MTPEHPRPIGRLAVVIAVVVVGVFLGRVGGPELEGLTANRDLVVGDCFVYPAGDDLSPERVETISCSEVHFAEVYATTAAGDTESCVGLFETYTGADNYWATDYVIGFLDVDDATMHCYLYAAADFAGSVAR